MENFSNDEREKEKSKIEDDEDELVDPRPEHPEDKKAEWYCIRALKTVWDSGACFNILLSIPKAVASLAILVGLLFEAIGRGIVAAAKAIFCSRNNDNRGGGSGGPIIFSASDDMSIVSNGTI